MGEGRRENVKASKIVIQVYEEGECEVRAVCHLFLSP